MNISSKWEILPTEINATWVEYVLTHPANFICFLNRVNLGQWVITSHKYMPHPVLKCLDNI